jgi:1,4-dihydroxy-6-naphthoate synthase
MVDLAPARVPPAASPGRWYGHPPKRLDAGYRHHWMHAWARRVAAVGGTTKASSAGVTADHAARPRRAPTAPPTHIKLLVEIRVGHSPDPDDAFMYWALTTDLVDTRGFGFEQVLADISTLNQWARAARLEVTALSLAAYPFVQQDYALLPHGASIGAGYGPIVVAREPIDPDSLVGREIVVPGAMTTAVLALRLVVGDFPFRELSFDQIPDEVSSGRADVGLLIHEGQLTFDSLGLHKVLDLGEWWLLETGLPLPLGVNVARRDVERLDDLSAVLGDAIRCGLDHRAEALEYALEFGRGIDAAVADRFVSMYVNELTQDYGDEGRSAVRELLRRGEEIGAFPVAVELDFVA